MCGVALVFLTEHGCSVDDIVNTQAIIRGHHAGLQLLAVILAALDCQMAGVLYRYLSDYLTPLLFAAALVWLWAESALAPLVQAAASGSTLHTVQHMLQGAMLAAVAVGICYSFCVYFAAEPGLLGQNPALYQNVSRLVQFWL